MLVSSEHYKHPKPTRANALPFRTAPHVGHLYSMVLADVIKRWQLLKGRKAVLSTGIDEHGMKVGILNTPIKGLCADGHFHRSSRLL